MRFQCLLRRRRCVQSGSVTLETLPRASKRAKSTSAGRLNKCRQLRPHAVQANDNHRFFYYKDMTPEEVMFIKCFDSRSQVNPGGKKGVADYTPHTAFVDPQTPASAPGRQSIEVRCLVFYE